MRMSGVDVGENSRLDEVAVCIVASGQTISAAGERGAVFLLADVDVAHDLFDGVGVDHRADVRFRIRAVADAQAP